MREQEKVLIVGNGGREHAIGWKLAQSPNKPQLSFAPGNAGTAKLGRNLNLEVTDVDGIVKVARENNAFIFVGPEGPLEKGIVNVAKENGLTIFGPTKEAARLETSKSWAIKFMQRHNIPHPDSAVFTNVSDSSLFLRDPKWEDIVIKADGLASGKGVFLPESKEDAEDAVKRIMIDKKFDDGSKVIIQERLKGKEVSLICLTDGNIIVPLIPAQDYKRLQVGDKGPNTGGMGGFAPTPALTKELLEEVYGTILRPTVDGMREEGHLFQGALYVGLMLTPDGAKVIEFNARFGDPETQLQMPLLRSDLLPALKSTTNGTLNRDQVIFSNKVAVGRVLAERNYPYSPDTGTEIKGWDKLRNPNVHVFHSGTIFKNGKIKTNGGRILTLVAVADTFPDSIRELDNSIGENGINFAGMKQRDDIAKDI